MSVEARLIALGRDLVERESQQKDRMTAAQDCAVLLHGCVSKSLDRFNETVRPEAPQLVVSLSDPRIDDKHLHAVQFELARGRHRGIVTVKSRGEVTLVGPFRTGKTEGPCRTFPSDAESEIETALGDFLIEFIQEAASP